jgi:hypothetical protein
MCEAGEEAGVHREGRWLTVGHAVLDEDVTQIFGLIQRDGACRAVACDVHATELGEFTQVLDFEPCTKLSLERSKPCGIIAGCGNVVHVECDHGEHVTGAEDVNARVGDALLPPVVDKPCTKEHVELARGMFQAVEAAFEVAHFGRSIGEAEGLAGGVHVLVDGGVEERNVDIELTQLKVAGGRDGEEETKAGQADERGEHFRIVEASTLAATFGDEPCFGAGDIAHGVRLDLVDPHYVDDLAVGGKVDEFPSAVVHERGVLLLHGGFPIWGLGAGESSAAGFRFHTISGGKESDCGRRGSGRYVT